MKRKLILRQEAERDLTEAHAWYEDKVPGLGSDFLVVVERTLESIQDNPDQFPLIYRNVHRALLSRFPYGVFFVSEKQTVSVLAVMHSAREPKKWRRRSSARRPD